jgi:hypothetical protein
MLVMFLYSGLDREPRTCFCDARFLAEGENVARPSVYCIFSASPATRRVVRVAKRGRRVALCERVQRSRDAASCRGGATKTPRE